MDGESPPSVTVEDWKREMPQHYWDPGRKLLKCVRIYQRIQNSSSPWIFLVQKFCVLRLRFLSGVSGAEIHLNSKISGGLNGIVIHPDAEIGPNCLIFQQVTIGMVKGAAPKIPGPIEVGNHVRVGANAVVVDSVAEGMTVVGIPAKPVVKTNHA